MKKSREKQRKRTPLILQMNELECGAVSLAIVLGFYGCYVPIEELREACDISRDGSKASNVARAAKRYGLQAKGFRYSALEVIQEACFPCIVFWRSGHFLVVEGFSNGYAFLNDPAGGHRKISIQEFNLAYSGLCLTFTKTSTFQRRGEPFDLKQLLRSLLKENRAIVLYICLISMFFVVPGLIFPAFLRLLIDEIFPQHLVLLDNQLNIAIIASCGFIILLSYIEGFFIVKINDKIGWRFSQNFLRHILHLPIKFYFHRSHDEIASRMHINDSLTNELVQKILKTGMRLVITAIYGGLLFFYDPRIASISWLICIGSFITMRHIYRSRIEENAGLKGDLINTTIYSIGCIRYIETIKSYGAEANFFAKWSGYFTKFLNDWQKVARKDLLLMFLPTMTQILGILVVIVFGIPLAIAQSLSIGSLFAMIIISVLFFWPVSQFISLESDFRRFYTHFAKLADVLKNPLEEPLKSSPTAQIFKKVCFGYTAQKPIIEEADWCLKPHKITAIAGAPGSGKSTLAGLLAGFLQPSQGKINRPDSVHIINHRPLILPGSVKENIALWKKDVSYDEIIKAAKIAKVHDRILSQQRGYDRELFDEGSLSSGELLRIEMARALVHKPDLLIIDHALTFFDQSFLLEFLAIMKTITKFVIIFTDDDSLSRHCDAFYLLKKGKILSIDQQRILKNQETLNQALMDGEE